tara:strand:- start:3069 stop:4928 length:1860 start_codon:yes stop_codon:yes gene_type:complete
MKENLIIYENLDKLNSLNLNSYKNIYGERKYLKVLNQNNLKKTKFIEVDQDLFNGKIRRQCDYEISTYIDKLLNQIININLDQFESEYLDKQNFTSCLKQKLIIECCQIFYPIRFAQLVEKRYNIKGNIDLNVSKISYFTYKLLKKNKLIFLDRYKIRKICLFNNYIYEKLYLTYFLLQFFLFLPLNFFKIKLFKTKTKLKKFLFSINLFEGLWFKNNNVSYDFMVDNLNIRKEDIIFTLDQPYNIKTADIKNKYHYDAVDFDKIFSKINYIDFFKQFFKKFLLLNLTFINLSFKYTYFANIFFRSFRSLVYWNIFYSLYSTKYHLVFMNDKKIVEYKIHNTNKVKTVFIYYSSTEETFVKSDNNITSCSDFAYMTYDILISDYVSKQWFKCHQTNLKHFINIGPLWTYIIKESRKNITKIKKSLSFSNNDKIISFFDHSLSRGGVMSQEEYSIFLDSIDGLLNQDFKILLKTKIQFRNLYNYLNEANILSFKNLLSKKNFIYANDLSISHYELIGISDIVISFPVSSITSESICSSIPTIIFDPLNNFNLNHLFSYKYPEIVINTKEELSNKIYKLLSVKEFNMKYINMQNNIVNDIFKINLNNNSKQEFIKYMLSKN